MSIRVREEERFVGFVRLVQKKEFRGFREYPCRRELPWFPWVSVFENKKDSCYSCVPYIKKFRVSSVSIRVRKKKKNSVSVPWVSVFEKKKDSCDS